MIANIELANLTEELRQFSAERDWDQFHSLKNLSMAMAVEAGEIMEILQWITQEESDNLSAGKKQELSEELGDVFIYLLRLADKADVDLVEVAKAKMQKNRMKYPAERVRGSSRKYTEYEPV